MSVAEVSVEEAAAWLQAGEAVMIDVREQDEYAAAHIEGVIQAPLSQMPVSYTHLRAHET